MSVFFGHFPVIVQSKTGVFSKGRPLALPPAFPLPEGDQISNSRGILPSETGTFAQKTGSDNSYCQTLIFFFQFSSSSTSLLIFVSPVFLVLSPLKHSQHSSSFTLPSSLFSLFTGEFALFTGQTFQPILGDFAAFYLFCSFFHSHFSP